MTREEYVKVCERCANKQYSMEKGLLCGLTEDYANFEGTCPSFKEELKQEEPEESIKDTLHIDLNVAKIIAKQRAVKHGANWFYWIAGLSIVNTLISSVHFLGGLGITQIIQAIMQDGYGAEGALVMLPTLIFAGGFWAVGYYANRFSKIAFIIGMVAYALDGLIFLYVQEMLEFGFHIFALFMIFKGYKTLRDMNIDEVVQDNDDVLDGNV